MAYDDNDVHPSEEGVESYSDTLFCRRKSFVRFFRKYSSKKEGRTFVISLHSLVIGSLATSPMPSSNGYIKAVRVIFSCLLLLIDLLRLSIVR